MKYLKKFENHTEYENARQNLILPNVSLCEQENDVHYTPIETRVAAKFNVTSTSEPTKITLDESISAFTEIEIDGVVQPTVVSAYTFDTLGEHTVKYTLLDPTSIGDAAFAGCTNLTSVTIPNSVTTIGMSAFASCFGLTSMTIPNSVTIIGSRAFQQCISLASVTIGDGVTNIGNYAFQNCSGLTSVTIGDGVTAIAQGVFQSCTNLSTIMSHIMNAPSVTGGTFYNVKSGGTLYVPKSSSGYETWMNDQGNLGLYGWTLNESL